MSTSIQALVTPQLLTWAREEAGYPTIERAAKATGFPVPKLLAWEKGDTRPTLRQAEKLAKTYHRPFTVLLLPHPPQTTPLAAKYRRLSGVKPGEESPQLRVAIREMIHRRQIALELFSELGESPRSFNMSVKLSESVEDAAARLRDGLGVSIETQYGWKEPYRAWRAWRAAVETLDVLVFQFGPVDIIETRGVTLLDTPLPVIGVNSKEIAPSRPFTMLHELVHLALSRAAEEKAAIEEQRSEQDWVTVERYVERVTSAILMPSSAMLEHSHVKGHGAHSDWDIDAIRKIAKSFSVTPSAAATRLLNLSQMDSAAYGRWKAAWDAFLKQHPPKDSGGFASPVDKALGRNGRTYTWLVLEALSTERITSSAAARYLDLGYHHIEELQRKVAIGQTHDEVPVFGG